MGNILTLFQQKYPAVRLCFEELDFDRNDMVTIGQALQQIEDAAKRRTLTTNENLRLADIRRLLAKGPRENEPYGSPAPRYDKHITANTVEEFLGQLTQGTPYDWRRFGNTYVVCPRDASRLAFRVTLSTDGLTVEEAEMKILAQQPTNSQITTVTIMHMPVMAGTDPTPELHAKLPALDLKNVLAMEALCRITEAARPDSVWELAGYKDFRTLEINPGPNGGTNASVIEANSNFSFGPVMEQTLPMDTNGLTDLFDPETGRIIPSPNPPDLAEGLKLLSTPGLVISRNEAKGETELMGMNGVLTQESSADQWEKISNLQALDTIRRNTSSRGVTIGAVVTRSNLPQTFLFKTVAGKIGILQITGFTNNPRGVKIRYKLVQNGSVVTNISAGISMENNADQVLAEQPPVVVETFPASGARDVAPGVTEIRVRFSKPMTDGSWSWATAWGNSTPESAGPPHYLPDQRTCVMEVRLEPGRTYAWWLNSDKFKNFADQAGQPAVPYLLTFQTKTN